MSLRQSSVEPEPAGGACCGGRGIGDRASLQAAPFVERTQGAGFTRLGTYLSRAQSFRHVKPAPWFLSCPVSEFGQRAHVIRSPGNPDFGEVAP